MKPNEAYKNQWGESDADVTSLGVSRIFRFTLSTGVVDDELDWGVFLVVVLNRFHATIFIIPRFV